MTTPVKYVNTNPEVAAMFRRLEQTRHSGGILKTESQILGNVLTSCALGVARLADRGHCATASAVAETMGLNRSTAGKWLAILANGRDDALISSYDARGSECGPAGHRNAYHYRTGA